MCIFRRPSLIWSKPHHKFPTQANSNRMHCPLFIPPDGCAFSSGGFATWQWLDVRTRDKHGRDTSYDAPTWRRRCPKVGPVLTSPARVWEAIQVRTAPALHLGKQTVLLSPLPLPLLFHYWVPFHHLFGPIDCSFDLMCNAVRSLCTSWSLIYNIYF